MAEESFEEKTEPGSAKKREEARNRGQVAKSMELNSAFILVFGLLILYFSGGALASNLAAIARDSFTSAGSFRVTATSAHEIIVSSMWRVGLVVGPMVIGLMMVGLAASVAQVGFVFSFEAMMPTLDKINPLTGIQKVLISRRSMVEIAKNILKVMIVGLVAYYALEGLLEESFSLMDADAEAVLGFMAKGAIAVGIKTGLAFLALAVLDYFYQRFEFEKSMKMTKQEVREENKQTEGDPLTKSRVRTIQRRIAYRRMMAEVPKADVVLTNPTHVAVAIKYDVEKMSAPRVVAKGADLVAQKIKDIAREHDVPIVEDRPLARALYKTVEIGEEIPEKLFQAVAQVLAYIYRLRNARTSMGMN